MPIDIMKAGAACAAGLAFPCAACEHHWSGIDKGLGDCARGDCGGPLGGFAFPQYKGPLPEHALRHMCFRCGSPNNLIGVKVVGADRPLAICRAHVNLIAEAEAGAMKPGANEIIWGGADPNAVLGQAPAKGKIILLGTIPPMELRKPGDKR